MLMRYDIMVGKSVTWFTSLEKTVSPSFSGSWGNALPRSKF